MGLIVSGSKAVGEAFTVKYRPCGSVKGTVGDFLDEVPAGHVVVLDNGGRTYATVWGDIMTVYSQKRGIAGTVRDGVCRDLPGMAGDIMVCHDTGVVVVPVDRAGEV